MTVSSSTARNDYIGNGVTVNFPVTFRFLEKTHLRVLRTVIATNETTVLTLDSLGPDGFSVVGAGQPSGGTVTVVTPPASATERLSILRNVPLTQEIDYIANDPFPAESHERGLDKLTMIVQQQGEIVGRAVVLPPQTTGVSNELPGPVALNLLRWKADLTGLENAVPPAIATVADGAVVDATVSPLAAINPTKIKFQQSGLGASVRDLNAKLLDAVIHVDDFFQAGDPDYTLAMTRAVARLKVLGGGTIEIPDKTILLNNVLIDNVPRICIRGRSHQSCINFIGTTTDLFTFRNCGFVELDNMRIDTNTPPSNGAIASFDNCAWIFCDRLLIGYYSRIWRGLVFTNAIGGIQGVYISRTIIFKHESDGILFEASNGAQVINDCYLRDVWVQWLPDVGFPTASVNCNGLRLNKTAGALQVINMHNVSLLGQYFVLNASGVRFFEWTDCYFDGYTYMEKMELGNVVNCWFSGGVGNNFPANAHTFLGGTSVRFDNCRYIPDSVAIPAGSTIYVDNAPGFTLKDVTWRDCTIAGGAHRGFVLGGGDRVKIFDCTIANDPTRYPNTQNIHTGVQILVTYTGIIDIRGGDFSVTNPIVSSHPDGTKINIRELRPFNPVKAVTEPAIPASGGGWVNNLGYAVRVYINGGSSVNVFLNSEIVAFASPTTARVMPGESIALTYVGAPTWIFQGE